MDDNKKTEELSLELRKFLGFSYVLEVSAGAAETNRQVVEKLKSDPTSPLYHEPLSFNCTACPKKIPGLTKYLAMTDTPMSATARIVREKFLPAGRQVPDIRPVFIGPCVTKKLEARLLSRFDRDQPGELFCLDSF